MTVFYIRPGQGVSNFEVTLDGLKITGGDARFNAGAASACCALAA